MERISPEEFAEGIGAELISKEEFAKAVAKTEVSEPEAKDCLHKERCYHHKVVKNNATALRKVLRMGGLSNAFFTHKRTKHRMDNFKDALEYVHPLNRATARKLYLGG